MRAVLSSFVLVLLFFVTADGSHPTAGFFLPDSVRSVTLNYRLSGDLIVLPVTINDSISVNLVLDTGCRNLILFGKKFKKLFDFHKSRKVEFSGLGEGAAVSGSLALGNSVRIDEIVGNQIPVVVVPERNLFGSQYKVDGVIGYEVFLRFEIELNPAAGTITFRPAQCAIPPVGYTTVKLSIVDARPVLASTVYINKRTSKSMQLMIDTGSTLGLLLKTTDLQEFGIHRDERILGRGFNGPIAGIETISEKLQIEELQMDRVQTSVVSSKWHNNASIGMNILKDYIVILNYSKQYACFKTHNA